MNEEKLLKEIENNPQKFGEIYEAFYKNIFGYVFRRTTNYDAAKDIAAETFLKAFAGIGKFKWRNISILYWVYRIATNECLTFIEQQKKKASVSLSEVESGLSNKIRADKDFDANKLEWKLQLAIQQLPEKQRVVFMLRYYDEMPYEQMSQVLETSAGALKASYHHAAKKIEDFILNH